MNYGERGQLYDWVLGNKVALLNTLGMAFVCLAYAAIHLSSWDAHFPTGSERRLWQTATCTLMGSLLIFGCGNLGINRNLISEEQGEIAIILGMLLSTLARTALIVEAFISFRSLPLGAYSTPSWTDWLPHIG